MDGSTSKQLGRGSAAICQALRNSLERALSGLCRFGMQDLVMYLQNATFLREIKTILGVAEDANECFSEATALSLQHEHTSTSNLEKSNIVNENQVLFSNVSASLVDISPKQVKQLHANNTAEVPGYPHLRATALHVQNSVPSNIGQFDSPSPTLTQTSGIVPPPLFRNVHAYQNTASGDAPPKSKVIEVNQPLRRKYLDEVRLKK